MMFRVLPILLIAVFAPLSPALSQDRWLLIAQGEVNAGKDTTRLDASKAKGSFKAIRFLVRNTDLKLSSTEISTSRCRVLDVQATTLKAGEQSTATQFEAGEHFIDSIDLNLEAAAPRKAVVTAWGLQSPSGTAAKRDSFPGIGKGARARSRFDLESSANRHSLHSCDGKSIFNQLALRARDGDVFIEGLKVTYDNDQTERILLHGRLKRNVQTKRYWLKGSKPVKAIELIYRSNLNSTVRVDLYQYQSEELVRSLKDRTKVAVSKGPGRCGTGKFWNSGTRSCSDGPSEEIRPFQRRRAGGERIATQRETIVQRRDNASKGCVADNTCTPIAIFFGTNRKRNDLQDRAGFGPDREQTLSWGRAIVTVPKAHGIGEIERPSYWNVRDLYNRMREDAGRHFVIPSEGVAVFAGMADFLDAVRQASQELTDFKDQAFVYVHGFRVDFDDALYRVAQLTYDLGIDRGGKRIPFGMPFLFSWPARGGVLDYATDFENARYSEDHLRDFLDAVVNKSGAKNVHLIAHSMGNHPLVEVLARIGAEARPNIRFNQIVLAAPDIDRNRFIELASKTRTVGKNVTLYASSADEALQWSLKAHSGFARAGDVPVNGPVVVSGVDTIDISDLSTAVFWSLNHSTYAEDTNLLQDLGRIVREGTVPPHDRTPILGRRGSGGSWYWIYPKPRTLW